MRTIREEPAVKRAVDEATLRWALTDDAWNAMTWSLARDPYSAGPPLTESGMLRAFVFDGARAIHLPTVRGVYTIEPAVVVIRQVTFEEAVHLYAGRA